MYEKRKKEGTREDGRKKKGMKEEKKRTHWGSRGFSRQSLGHAGGCPRRSLFILVK